MLESMTEFIPAELLVLIISALPLLEMRFAIPLGMAAWGLSPWVALVFALIGNIAVTPFILVLLPIITEWLRKQSKWIDRQIDHLFEKTRSKHSERMAKLGHLALIVFVAIPLPGSGAWSGSLVSYIFGVKKKLALLLISLGLVCSSFALAFGTDVILNIIHHYF